MNTQVTLMLSNTVNQSLHHNVIIIKPKLTILQKEPYAHPSSASLMHLIELNWVGFKH